MKTRTPALFLALVLAAPAHAEGAEAHPRLLAHRGVAQAFDRAGLTQQGCTASRMLPPVHGYLENTIASMRAAFEYGADMVEVDIHPTGDGEFVVFHDWRLECRTDGTGVTRERPLAYLKALDIGHGYSADGGATFPFRGKFVGAMPTLAEALSAFPDRRFLVNIKSDSSDEGRAVVAYLRALGYDESRVDFSGGDRAMESIRAQWPGARTLSRSRLKSCVLRYLVVGWSGHVPGECGNAVIYVPVNYAGLLWGWPGEFVERMTAVNSRVFVIGPYTSDTQTSGTTGIDSVEELRALPPDYTGGVVTDRIDLIGVRR